MGDCTNRYKANYQYDGAGNLAITEIFELTDSDGIVLSSPITHIAGSAGFTAALAEIGDCECPKEGALPFEVCYEAECEALLADGAFTTAPDTPDDLTGVEVALDIIGGTQLVLIDDPVTTYTWRDYFEGGRLKQLLDATGYSYELTYAYAPDDGEDTQINVRLSVCAPSAEGASIRFSSGDSTVNGGTETITARASGTLFVCLEDGVKVSETLVDCFGEVIADYTLIKCPEKPESTDLSSYEIDAPCVSSNLPLWLLLSKLEIGALAADFPGIIQVGDLGAGAIHPSGSDAGQAITGWNAYAICSSTQPPDDDNQHYWIAGSADDYGIVDFVRSNPDPDCPNNSEERRPLSVFDKCAYEKQVQTPIRIDDGLCVLVEITAEINYSIFGADNGPWGINLDTPTMSSGTVVQYMAGNDVILGNGPHTIDYPNGLPDVANVVLSDGENTITIAIDTAGTDQVFNTATAEKVGRQGVVREVYCDGTTKIIRCLNNEELTGVTPVKCGAELMPDPVYIVGKICYVDKESPNTRADFSGYVDDASAQTFPNAIGNPACPITVDADGTGVEWSPGTTALRIVIPAGQSRQVALSWPESKCVVISGGTVDTGNTVQFDSDASILASNRPDIPGSVNPGFTGQNTNQVIQTGIDGPDRILISSDGTTQMVVTYTNNSGGDSVYFFGSFIGQGEPIYYCHEMYSNGTEKIYNSATGAEAAAIGEWQQINCDSVPAQQTCCERTNELLEELINGECPTCKNYSGCLFQVRGFDYQDHATWVAGDGMSWNVNGTQVDIDVATLSAALPKSAWYAPIWDALPGGWAASVIQDAASDNSGPDDKVTFEFSWSGKVCETQTVVVERLTGSNDTLTMTVNPDGTYSASWLDDGGNPIDSNDSILLCDGTPATISPVTGTLNEQT